MRFLIIRLSSIGDIVHALPAVSALARTFPEAKIDWVVEKRYAVLLAGNPYLDRVVELDTLGWRKDMAPLAALTQMARGIAALRAESYDAAIDFQGLIKSAVIARLSRAPTRLGFAENWLREPAAGIFYNERVAPHGRRHVTEMNLALVERLDVRTPEIDQWEFPLPRRDEDDREVEQRLAALEARDLIVVNPGGGWQSKRWAPENYAELIRRLDPEPGWRVLLTGSPAEEELIQNLIRRSGSRQAHYFPSTLVQYMALARRARLFVGGDTGPMHLAAAVGAPIVAIFSNMELRNTPERNGPFLSNDITLIGGSPISTARPNRAPPYIDGVTVDAVLSGIRDRLARARSAGTGPGWTGARVHG